jgi:hypothetical protein
MNVEVCDEDRDSFCGFQTHGNNLSEISLNALVVVNDDGIVHAVGQGY